MSYYERIRRYVAVPTVGTIFIAGVVCMFTLPYMVSYLSTIFNALDMVLKPPTVMGFKDIYNAVYPLYSYIRAVLTNKYGLAALIALSLSLMGLEVRRSG